MNKSIKRNVVISAILAIMLCISLIAGATFALFTSESGVNIAVTSGKVDVVASVVTDSVYTKSKGTEYTQGGNHMYSGEEAKFENGELTVSNMVPGDGITFNIVIKNNSSIEVKYRTIISCLSDNGLLSGLNVEIGNVAKYDGTSIISDYETLAVNSDDITVPVKIELPEDAGNVYQGKTLTLSYKVEAVQGNADMTKPDTDTYYVYTAMDLVNFKKNYNKIAIMNDIDLTGYAWKGLSGLDMGDDGLTILGNKHYVSNLSAPLVVEAMGTLNINELTIKNSTMAQINDGESSTRGFGAFLQLMRAGTVTLTDCCVDNVKMITEADTRVGGLIGVAYANVNVSNCTVKNCEFKAFGSIGGIIAQACDSDNSVYTISNCSVNDTILKSIDDGGWRVGSIIGSAAAGKTYVNACSYSGNTLSQDNKTAPDHELFGRITPGGELYIDGGKYIADGVIFKDNAYMISSAKGLVYCAETFNTSNLTEGKTFKLTQNIDMSGIKWTPWGNETQYFCGTFDGQNKTISNLTINDTGVAVGHATGFIGRLGANGNGTKTIKDVTFDNASVSGYHYVAVAVGYNEFGIVKNVKVINSTVTNNHNTEDATGEACGDKAGAVVGMVGASAAFADENGIGSVDCCSATNCTIAGARDVGQIVGCAYQKNGKTQVTNCTVTEVTVFCNAQAGTCMDNGEDKTATNVNSEIVGRLMICHK